MYTYTGIGTFSSILYITADKLVVSVAAGGVCSSVSILAKCFSVSVLFIHAKQPQPGAIVCSTRAVLKSPRTTGTCSCLYSCLYQFCFNLYSRVCLNTRLNGVKSILFEFQFHTRWSKEEAEIYLFNANFAVSYLFLQI